MPTDLRNADVLGVRMAYYERGAGDPIALLHGNPTSSCIWRNLITSLDHLGRCVAPDLIGMGTSQKLPRFGPGQFVEHRRYLDTLPEQLAITGRVALVGHDWGAGLAID